MGCGISRYGVTNNLGFEPILRKLEDLRKNDRVFVTVDDTPSTKLLVKDGEGDVVPNADDTRKSISSPQMELVKVPSLEQKESLNIDSRIKKNGAEEKEKEVKSKNEEVVAAKRGDKKEHRGGGEEGEESNYDDDDDDDEEEGRVSDYDGSELWIGSPSFREYCTNDCESEDSLKDGGSSDGEKKEIKIKGDKSNPSPNSNEVLGSEPTRKGRKGRRFRKAFPLGKPSMKNFLHVSSCYNPKASAAAARDKHAKPIEKPV